MNTYWEKKFFQDVLIASFIVFIPFSLYLHTLFEDNQDSLKILGFTFNHNRSTSALYVYSVLIPTINLMLASLWFYTNRFWWRKFIMIPIGLFIYQLAKIHLYFDGDYGDIDFIISLGITSLTLLIIYRIDFLLFKKSIKKKEKKYLSKAIIRYDFKRVKKFYSDLKYQTNKISNNELSQPQISLLQNLYYLKVISEKNQNNYLKSTKRGNLIEDYVIVFLLILTPIISYSFKIIPDGVQSIKFGFITITSNGFLDVGYFIWFCALKFCSILPLAIWFVTSGAWWRYSLFSPILIFSYQLHAVLFNISPILDENEYVAALPFIMVIVIGLVFLSSLVKYQSKIMDLYENIKNQIDLLLKHPDLQNEAYQKRKQEFEALKNKSNSKINAKENIDELLKLKKQVAKIINELN